MKVFVSAGEPSGDLHGANLVRALRAQAPDTHVTAFGGDGMRAAGADILFPLPKFAVMGLRGVVQALPALFRIGNIAIHHIRTQRPDAVVMIDYPGFHLELAKRIRDFGVPTYFFVPPQIWAWRSGRVRTVRKCFTGVLTALPFEDEWYRKRGVQTHYIGHPYFDELARQRLDPDFLAQERAKPGARVTLLPGSRNSEIAANARTMLATAQKIHVARPDVRFLVGAFNAPQAEAVRALLPAGLPVEIHVGRTPEVIELADACLAVSGSVSLELMYRAKPTVVMYCVGRVEGWVLKQLINVKYMSLVNLLLNEPLYPEYPTWHDRSAEMARDIVGWLNDPARRQAVVDRLIALRSRAAVPGACDRAAAFLVGNTPQAALRAA
ncbi:lipid-A-disaccharide synthase [Gemmata sp. JC717]|uniref:lipid-A-disaccharide synthase n=1 Tax=Gemmata algarum TaxID=2975278 RepID=UPI0021BB04F5|nr:lipid-A-disaccharide synthase [Gemmata algarum]MDY3556643.1 lipid-A-disaccharide synthase [Gemmata algarum]